MKNIYKLLLCLLSVFALTACSNKMDTQESSTAQSVETYEETKTDNDTSAEENTKDTATNDTAGNDVSDKGTRIVTDLKGEVEIPANPQRIADLTGDSDILSILGYNVVATANSDAYDYTVLPSYLQDTLKDAKIVGFSMQDTMDVEAIMSTNPDLIIMSSVQEKMYDTLKEIAPTIMIEKAQINWKDDIRTMAELFDRKEAAEEWIKDYESKAVTAGNEIKEKLGDNKTYMSFLASGGQFYIFSKAGLGDILSTDMGLLIPEKMPEQEDISLPVVNYEGLAEIDADYIIVAATDEDLAELEKNSIWTNLRAVKDNHVIILPTSPYFNQGYSAMGRLLLLDELKGYLLGLE